MIEQYGTDNTTINTNNSYDRFCVVIRFFSSSPQRTMTSDFEGFSFPDFIHYFYFPILILEKEPVFPFLMFSTKQGNYLGPFL